MSITQIDYHIACAVSGIVADSRTLVDFARVEAQNHRFMYEEPISVFGLTQAVSDLALNFGEGDETSKKKPIVRTINSGSSLRSCPIGGRRR